MRVVAAIENFESLKKNYLVAGLTDDIIAELAKLAHYEVSVSGENLITKGDKSSDLYVILEGNVDVYTSTGDKLTSAGPGSLLGEIALVDDHPRSADAVCTGLVKYARFPAAELRRYMNGNRNAGFIILANLARVLSARLRNSDIVIETVRLTTFDHWKFAL